MSPVRRKATCTSASHTDPDGRSKRNGRSPWPKSGNDPFALDTSYSSRLIACLNFTHDAPWGGYAEGFRRLADIGVDHIERTGRDHDYLVYPILFGYRHYTELSLKEIIRDARQFLDKEGSVPETHNLEHLWNTAEPLLEEIADSPETFRDVRECIAHFARLDPISESFRYPVKKTGELTLPKQLHNLDLGQTRAVMERLASFLDAATTHTSVELEHKLATISLKCKGNTAAPRSAQQLLF